MKISKLKESSIMVVSVVIFAISVCGIFGVYQNDNEMSCQSEARKFMFLKKIQKLDIVDDVETFKIRISQAIDSGELTHSEAMWVCDEIVKRLSKRIIMLENEERKLENEASIF